MEHLQVCPETEGRKKGRWAGELDEIMGGHVEVLCGGDVPCASLGSLRNTSLATGSKGECGESSGLRSGLATWKALCQPGQGPGSQPAHGEKVCSCIGNFITLRPAECRGLGGDRAVRPSALKHFQY